MLLLSISLTFMLGWFLPSGEYLLNLFISTPVLITLPKHWTYFFLVYFHIALPAVFIYIVLRLTKINNRLKIPSSSSFLFSTAILLFAAIISLRFFASLIEGGGASFAVALLTKYFVIPARLLIIIGLILTLIETVKYKDNLDVSQPLSKHEFIFIVLIILMPVVPVSIMFIPENGPLKFTYNTNKAFNNECNTTSEFIKFHPDIVTGVYIERNLGYKYEGFNKSHEYYSFRGSSIEYSLYRNNKIPLVEILNYNKDQSRYELYDEQNPQGKPTDELKSNFAVKKTFEEIDPDKSDIKRVTVKVIKLSNNEVVGQTTYVTSRKLRKACGKIVDDKISDSDFINRVFTE